MVGAVEVVRMVRVIGMVRMFGVVRLGGGQIGRVVWMVVVVEEVGMVGVIGMVRVLRMVRVVRMVTLLVEHYFVQISVGRWSLLLDVLWFFRVSWTYGPNMKNNFTSLLLTGLLTGLSR